MINLNDKRVLVSRIFPEIGVELLKEAGLSVTAWDQDRPMFQDELIEKAKGHHALYCSSSDKIGAVKEK